MHRVEPAELRQQQQYMEKISQILKADYHETGKSKSYFLHTYGCQLNENDGEKIAGILEATGYKPAKTLKEADFIVLNTCSVREHADERLFGNLGAIKHLRQQRPDLMVALCGCMMMQPGHVSRVTRYFSFVDLIFGPQDIHRLPEMLYQRLISGQKQYDVGQEDVLAEGLPIRRERRFRALCSIMYGCNNFCTYCIVPYTRGRERSRMPEDILNELRGLADSGYREVMLLGQNVNSYGKDIQDARVRIDFADLLAAVADLGFYRIRFLTSHPKDITEKLLSVMAEHESIERHLHLPLQSGSNRILERMNRQYTREQYLQIVQRARRLMPDLFISTDLIVGFPGETEKDFEDTLDVMREARFESAFTFLFSKRTGTPAAEMPDQIDEEVMKARFARLVELQNKLSLEANKRFEGRWVDVLVEGPSLKEDKVISGRTSQNQLVNFTVPDLQLLPAELLSPEGCIRKNALEGHLVKVRITEAKTFSLVGTGEAWQT